MSVSPNEAAHVARAGMIPRSSREQMRCDTIHLAWAQSRLAHRYKREAQKWEAQNNHRFYADCRLEANRLWRDAKAHLNFARTMA